MTDLVPCCECGTPAEVAVLRGVARPDLSLCPAHREENRRFLRGIRAALLTPREDDATRSAPPGSGSRTPTT